MKNVRITFVVFAIILAACASASAALLPPDRPDLQSASDSGFQSSDNYTNSAAPVFDVSGVAIGATVELLRDGVPVASLGPAAATTLTLTDPSPPANAQVSYLSRQTLNAETATTPFALIVTFDNTRPTLTIDQGLAQADPTPTLPIAFRINASEFIYALGAADFNFAGSTTNIGAVSINIPMPSGSQLFAQFSGVSLPGLIKAVIPENSVNDRAGNPCFASTSKDNEVTFTPVPATLDFRGRILRNAGPAHVPLVAVITDTATGQVYRLGVTPAGYFRQKNIPFYQGVTRRFILSIRHKEIQVFSENTDVSQTFWNMERWY